MTENTLSETEKLVRQLWIVLVPLLMTNFILGGLLFFLDESHILPFVKVDAQTTTILEGLTGLAVIALFGLASFLWSKATPENLKKMVERLAVKNPTTPHKAFMQLMIVVGTLVDAGGVLSFVLASVGGSFVMSFLLITAAIAGFILMLTKLSERAEMALGRA